MLIQFSKPAIAQLNENVLIDFQEIIDTNQIGASATLRTKTIEIQNRYNCKQS